MTEFLPGQRWINTAQLQMGLGAVVTADFRTVTIEFPATGETFVYARESVPLTRVRFAPGDHILTLDDIDIEVTGVDEADGLLTYQGLDADGASHRVEESLLNNFIQLNRPTERLFNGQVDRDIWFDLRYRTRRQRARLAQSELRGLTGGRISLIPHQLYIASEVARRYAPRVLLADEVGLGKTIEAGLILHQQRITERAGRILLVVPESLVHQWLVEMRRRFNLVFSLFDRERIEAISTGADDTATSGEENPVNPFHTSQLVLCSLEFLCQDDRVLRDCAAGEWDLLVVDEAHHLAWSESAPSEEYRRVETLARATPGVLLLTATPEQLGKAGHFARLRLLDPGRFQNYGAFLEEEASYEPVARVAAALLDGRAPSAPDLAALREVLSPAGDSMLLEGLADDASSDPVKRKALLDALLDRHGTGRVLFRNTRATVAGFPERCLIPRPVALPEVYRSLFDDLDLEAIDEAQLLLCPELFYAAVHEGEGEAWTRVDPRVAELVTLLGELRPEKVLVICAGADTALDLVDCLKQRHGMDAAVFHEGMTLVERDRAAAWFADPLAGVRIMICSEIGSEGRNFQFTRHLVLFDLPLNPDLLEQRIGRLDRIGQQHAVQIHALYLEQSAQDVMFHWYRDALDAFEHTTPAGQQVFVDMETRLVDALRNPTRDASGLIEASGQRHRELVEALARGRDRLLELNACRPETAARLVELAQAEDAAASVQPYMEDVFDAFGVDYEIHSDGCYAVSAGTHMLMPFPMLPDEGLTVTYDRDTALLFEDIDYLSWDHPLVTTAMDLVESGEMGNTSVVAAAVPGVARGTLLLEAVFLLESAASRHLRSDNYLPTTLLRVLLDQGGKRYDRLPPIKPSTQPGDRIKPELAKRIVGAREALLRKMVQACEKIAGHQVPGLLLAARQRSETQLDGEIDRLQALARVNPNVRQEEIDHLVGLRKDLGQRIDEAQLRLDALRVIVAT